MFVADIAAATTSVAPLGERDQAFNLEDYKSLRMRIRGDGRTYLVSLAYLHRIAVEVSL